LRSAARAGMLPAVSERDRLRRGRDHDETARRAEPATATAAPQLVPSVEAVLGLQRGAGNQATVNVLSRRAAAAPGAPEPQAVPTEIRAHVENLSGMDLSDVQVHLDSPLPGRLGQVAYTQGAEIHLAPGQSQDLIGHELAHVVQQRGGRVGPGVQA
jgi:Domain of unknown function (DUF4157)